MLNIADTKHDHRVELKICFIQYEYSTNNPFVGAKVLIHDPDIRPDMSQEGINIGVGTQADIALRYTEVCKLTISAENYSSSPTFISFALLEVG